MVKEMIVTDVTDIGDPFILRDGEKYYMYATSAKDGFLYFLSDDLKNWEKCGYCYKGNPDLTENDYWAPEVYKIRDKYYMLFTARWREKHSLRLWLAEGKSPCGPFVNVYDRPLFDFGYAVIDGTLFFDDDGQTYLYYSRDCSENIINGVHASELYCVKFNAETLVVEGEAVKLTTPDTPWETSLDQKWRWNEAPAVIKHNGVYYLNYSVNCFDSREYSVCLATSESPMKNFVKRAENPILKYREGEFSGPGHNCLFTDKNGELKTAFHIHTFYEKPSGNRRACIANAGFTTDGGMKFDV